MNVGLPFDCCPDGLGEALDMGPGGAASCDDSACFGDRESDDGFEWRSSACGLVLGTVVLCQCGGF